MKAQSRSAIYIANIVIAVLAFVCAVLVIVGVITQENILAVVALTLALYSAFSAALARLNLTPDQ